MNSNLGMRKLSGLATARGFAAGPVFLYRGDGEIPVPEYVVAEDRVDEELLRVRRAHDSVLRDLESLIAVLRERSGRQDVRVFECHLMILEDEMLVSETAGHISRDRLNAEAAVRRTAANARSQFERMNDPYFRERVRDLDDIERRLLKALTGFSGNPLSELKTPSVVVADDLTPSETIQMPRELVLGFATNGGSATSHAALLARAMGIPAVTGLGVVTESVTPGEIVLLDGTNGELTLRADSTTRLQFETLINRQRMLVEDASTGLPAGTLKDGDEVLLYANFHPGAPVAGLRELGARGIGLYRSEYLWLTAGCEPSEETQYRAYSDAVRFAMTLSERATVAIRVLDIGGDKTVSGITKREANPFLGNRSIRYLLKEPRVFRTQLRAILRASAFGKVGIMYPMVSCVEEVRAANRILEEVRAELRSEGLPSGDECLVGTMIEVPAAALNADAIAEEVDFLSIGTNDLVQYTMAADRGNESVAHLYQPLNPGVLKLMRMAIAAAKKNEIWIAVCGESAADPLIGVLWAAMGVDCLSMSATYIPVISKILSALTRADLNEYAAMVKGLGDSLTAGEILARCRAWMGERIPGVESYLI